MNSKFDAVVISGGGSKGLTALGVLHYYYEKGAYDPRCTQEYAGASIGAGICLLLICGYTPMELFRELYLMKNFFDIDRPSIWDVIQHLGLFPIDSFVDKLKGLVEKKLGRIPSLGELKKTTGKRLFISVSDVTRMIEERCSPETHPDLSCVEAVKMSCNLPIIFRRMRVQGSCVVDGGLVNNFPWDYISPHMNKILGVVMVGGKITIPDDTFVGYSLRIMMLLINQSTELQCQIIPEKITLVKVSWKEGFLQFTMETDQKLKMFLAGYQTAKQKSQTVRLLVKEWDFIEAGASRPDLLDIEISDDSEEWGDWSPVEVE